MATTTTKSMRSHISGSTGLDRKKGRKGYLFILPWIIGFVLFFSRSLIDTVVFAFSKVSPGTAGVTTEFTGWLNFINAFTKDEKFPQLLTTSIVNMLTDVPFQLIFSFFCAVLLYQKFKFNRIVRSIFFLTVILSSGVFLKMSNDTAMANQFSLTGEMSSGTGVEMIQSVQLANYLQDIGLSEKFISYITAPVDRLFSVISSSGIQIFVFLAGLNAIPASLYESCRVEGATGWETFWKITFPMVAPLILVNTVYTIIDSFMSTSNTLLDYIYREGIRRLQFGYASALSWIYFLTVGVFLGIVALIFSKRTFYYT